MTDWHEESKRNAAALEGCVVVPYQYRWYHQLSLSLFFIPIRHHVDGRQFIQRLCGHRISSGGAISGPRGGGGGDMPLHSLGWPFVVVFFFDPRAARTLGVFDTRHAHQLDWALQGRRRLEHDH